MESNEKSFVVDANAIAEFQKQRITGVEGDAISGIKTIKETGFIGIDIGEFILTEWYSVVGGLDATPSFRDWVADMLATGKIRFCEQKKYTDINKKLSAMGMSNSDKKYIYCAITHKSIMIVTNDIDFHDPKIKSHKSEYKNKIKSNKSGCICKMLKSMGIYVGGFLEINDAIIVLK